MRPKKLEVAMKLETGIHEETLRIEYFARQLTVLVMPMGSNGYVGLKRRSHTGQMWTQHYVNYKASLWESDVGLRNV